MHILGIRISINATPEIVFGVLTDYANYPQWNPWLSAVEGETAVGKKLVLKPRLWFMPFRIQYEFERVQPNSLLFRRQTGPLQFLVRSQRERALYTKTNGSTIYSTKLNLDGPFGKFAHMLLGPTINKGLRDEAFALKAYCEAHFPLLKTDQKTGIYTAPELEVIRQ